MPFLQALSERLRRPFQRVQRGAQAVQDYISRDVTLDFSLGLLVPSALKDVLTISEAEAKRQRTILKSRAFHEGDHGVKLTERLKEFLGDDSDDQPSLNFTQAVTMAVTEKLKIEDFDCPDTSYLEWAKEVWDDSRMRTKQSDVWEETGVDGEHFILVNWNAQGGDQQGEVELIPHQRYTDPNTLFEGTEGDGFGIWMAYPGNDTSRRPLYAVKRSTETNDKGQKQKQITVYRPDQIERYYLDAKAGWMPLYETDLSTGEQRSWPEPWVTVDGRPMGIPVVHLKTPRLRAEAKNAQRIQRALNKLYLDFLIANDETAFRTWLFAGWDPEQIVSAVGSWIGSPKAKKDEFFAQAVDGADTSGMLNGIEKTIAFIGMVSSTPVSRLTMTGQVARAETLQAQDGPLDAKVDNRKESYGQGITDVFRIAARIQNRFGSLSGPRLNEDSRVAPIWKSFTVAAIAANADATSTTSTNSAN
jgi:hypothetical protein